MTRRVLPHPGVGASSSSSPVSTASVARSERKAHTARSIARQRLPSSTRTSAAMSGAVLLTHASSRSRSPRMRWKVRGAKVATRSTRPCSFASRSSSCPARALRNRVAASRPGRTGAGEGVIGPAFRPPRCRGLRASSRRARVRSKRPARSRPLISRWATR